VLIVLLLIIIAMFTISYLMVVSRHEDKKVRDRYISGMEEEGEW